MITDNTKLITYVGINMSTFEAINADLRKFKAAFSGMSI